MVAFGLDHGAGSATGAAVQGRPGASDAKTRAMARGVDPAVRRPARLPARIANRSILDGRAGAAADAQSRRAAGLVALPAGGAGVAAFDGHVGAAIELPRILAPGITRACGFAALLDARIAQAAPRHRRALAALGADPPGQALGGLAAGALTLVCTRLGGISSWLAHRPELRVAGAPGGIPLVGARLAQAAAGGRRGQAASRAQALGAAFGGAPPETLAISLAPRFWVTVSHRLLHVGGDVRTKDAPPQ